MNKLISEIKEKYRTIEVTDNGFITFVNTGAAEPLPIYIVYTDDLLSMTCEIVSTSSHSAEEFIDGTMSSVHGVSKNGENYVFKHVVRMEYLNLERFIKEIELLIASLNQLKPKVS